MKRALKLAGIAALVLVGIAVVAYGIGTTVPLEHSATVAVDLPAAPERVWSLVRDVEGGARWRAGVTKVERLPDRDGHPAFREWNEYGTLDYAIESEEPPRRMVARILDNADFGGTWTYVVEPREGGSRLTLTEDGEIESPLFRFFARYVFGYDATMKGYAASLEAELGGSSG